MGKIRISIPSKSLEFLYLVCKNMIYRRIRKIFICIQVKRSTVGVLGIWYGECPKISNTLSSFRISTRRLRIEHGRYLGEKPEERLYTICNVVEDDVHFLCQCLKYASQRKTLSDSLIKKIQIFC